MARVLTPPAKTALTANTDLEILLNFEAPDDPDNVVIGDMKSKLIVKYSDGSIGVMPPVKITDVLDNVATVSTGTELSNFRATLIKLRDAGFDLGGIPEV